MFNFSLNKTRRQRELLRITHENQAILRRITSKEPHYHHRRWLEEWNVSSLIKCGTREVSGHWGRKCHSEVAVKSELTRFQCKDQ